MKVILLAAGRSKRMFPIKDKNFIKFCGKELIRHQIERLAKAGCEKFVIVGNAQNKEGLNHILSRIPAIHFVIVEQEDLDQGMAGGILACKDVIGDEEILIVSSNDVVSDKAYSLILQESVNNEYDILILGKKMSDYFPGGYLKVDSNLRISSIREKPGRGNEPSDLVNIVIHYYRNPIKLFQYLESTSSVNDDRYETAIDKMIRAGVKMKAVIYDDIWQAVKYPWHIFQVSHFFFQETPKTIAKNIQISPDARINGEVIIEEGVRLFEGAIINGPCYLGKNVIVANNSLIRNAFLDDSCTVGFGTEIARSIVGKNCWFHDNYIGDSILSENCSFGSGAVTGNLRLDEEQISMSINDEKISTGTNKLGTILGSNIRIGVNTSLMPGIRIGSDSFIGAGIVLANDVPENKYVRGKWYLKMDDNKKTPNPEKRKEMHQGLGSRT